MKKLLSIALLVIALGSVSIAQVSSPQYFDNTIIIKFESDEVLAKSSESSMMIIQQQVEEIISQYGFKEKKPIWDNQKELTLQRSLASKNKFKIANQDITSDLRRIFEYTFTEDIDPKLLASKLSKMPGVEYAEPRYIYQTQLTTNDPIRNVFVDLHKFEAAWDISTGSSDVIIGIVDSGVNYNHEDLDDKLWVNEGEIPDNGIDDDGNGFIDDHIGWDFWESGLTFDELVSDNDPMITGDDHGAHVAGIATAEPNNEVGLAGTGFNSRYMAIKAGGILDDPSTEDDESRSVAFGYDGILYGVANGADIINNSWSGSGFSFFGQEVVNVAVAADVLIVASSGNDGSTDFSHPASLDGVLSVGSVGADSTRTSFSNYGLTVDVFATGEFVRSTDRFATNTYGAKSGTSMSSPVVAGLAGLIKAQYPDWSSQRILYQIRNTSISMDTSPEEQILLGKGFIDAEAALTNLMPGIELRDNNITDSEGSSLTVGENGLINLDIINYGETTSNLVVSIEAFQENINLITETVNVGSIATDDSTIVQFEFSLPEDYDLSDVPTFLITYSDASMNYSDFSVVEFDNLGFAVMAANNVSMSFGSNGTIGFTFPIEQVGGVGFIPAGFDNILYSGGVIMATDANELTETPARVSNAVYGDEVDLDLDFEPENTYQVVIPGEIADAQGNGSFVPNESAGLQGVRTEFNTYAFADEEVENAVYVQYKVTNTSEEALNEFYFGLFSDWDVDIFSSNSVLFDAPNDIMYVFSGFSNPSYPYVAIVTMQESSSNLAIQNGFSGTPTEFRFGLFDGYTDEEKLTSLKAGNNSPRSAPTDISTVVASGPYNFNPDVTISLGFIYVYGSDLVDLRENVIAARSKFVFSVDEPGTYTPNEVETEVPLTTSIYQNYPNPFNPSTEINFDLANTGFTELSIYNILGQRVQTLVSEVRNVGSHSVRFDASRLNSGVYFAVLKSGDVTQTIKMTLLK